MRPTLLKSFLFALIFWFVVTTLWWSLQRPEVNLSALAQLKAFMPFLPFDVPEDASILSSISVQRQVFTYWTIPVLFCVLLSGLAGYSVLWLKARGLHQEREGRETGKGTFRGVTLTLGDLPVPNVFPRDSVDLSGPENAALIAPLTGLEVTLLEDILGTISAHSADAYAGEGVSSTLEEHVSAITYQALQGKKRAGLSALVAAGHELGKITAYKKNPDGSWTAHKRQDVEGARILATLESWYALPALERNAVMMAVKYHSTPKFLPEPEGDVAVHRLAKELLNTSDETVAQVVVQEKQKTLDTVLSTSTKSLSDIIFDAFLESLPSLSFQNRGLPKGVAAVAWKMGTRIYMLEIKLRETVTAKIPLEVRGALTPNPRDRSRLQPFTVELLKALESRGWLVKTINDVTLDAKDALWNVKAGKLDFKGVIVIDIPAEYLQQLPSGDSMYDIAVTGALFNTFSGISMSKQDLLGSVLRPSADKPAAEV
jgi:hypothetical protein